MNKILVALFIGFLFLPVAGQTGPGPTYTVSGTVKDKNGAVVAGAKVRLLTRADKTFTTITDRDGKYEFVGNPVGQYRVYASAPGFAEFSGGVDLREDTNFDLVLAVGEGHFTVTAEIGNIENIERIPQPVNVIDSREIQLRVTSFTAQLAKEEPGINIQRTSPSIGAIVVRGLTGKNVVNFIDGVRYTTSAQRGGINTFFNLNDASNLETVEVLRGPNSAQYGSDSLGGTVNLLTRSLDFGSDDPEFHGELGSGYNSGDRSFGGSGMFGYGTRKLNAFANLSARRVNTLRTASGLDSHSAITRFLGLPSTVLYDRNTDTEFTQYGGSTRITYSPSDEHQLIGLYQRSQQDDGKRFDQLLGGDGNLIADLRNLMLDFGYVRYVTTAIPGFESASFTGSFNSQREERVNQGGQGNPVGDITHQYERTNVFGFSSYLERQLPFRNRLVIGGDVYFETINSPAYVANTAGISTPSRPRVPDEATFDSGGLFVQDAWEAIPDRLRITGALRYSGASYQARTADAPVINGRPLWGDDELSTGDWSGRIGGTVRIADGFWLALNYSHGFRYPNMTDLGTLGLTGDGFEVDHLESSALGGKIGTTALASAVSTGIPVSQQRSEVSNNFDFGLRYRHRRFDFEFTAFRLDIDDAITKQALILPAGAVGQTLGGRPIVNQLSNGTVFVQDVATPVLVRANYTAAKMYGVELEAEGQITRELTARGNFTFIHAADKETGLPPNIEGGTPPPTGFVSFRYDKSRFWIEAYSTLAAKQDRLSTLDLGDRRTGGARSRAQIQNYFRRGACVNGLTTPGPTGCGSAGGILIATGETLAQVQNRLLPIGATINGVTIVDNNSSVPLFTYLPSYATANIRGGFRFNERSTISVAFENITDAFYRNPSWGIDGSGRSVTVQWGYKF
ncbi:MAG TPA: TonB-dependent receptor [Pyrinomonadaceae bacterium]|nr:TonB-dependent receptor [Pyrinomonadaceae bacterium]